MKIITSRRFRRLPAAFFSGMLLIIVGCRGTATKPENVGHPIIPVTISPVHIDKMVTWVDLNATSAFMLKSEVKSPVTGFIDNMAITQGDAVDQGKLLFRIRTKEASALLGDTVDNLKFSGVVPVNAATGGIISAIDRSKGDFVSEGDQLCQIAIKNSFAFILDVPFELSGLIKLNSSCDIVLPDSQSYKGIIRSRLPSMSANSQTERYIIKLAGSGTLPENLTGKIRIVKDYVKEAISLPKSAILTNETMQDFWVMKMVNDSMAVRVPVTTGLTAGTFVQILKPQFKPSDLFLTSGNYGLGDTAFVRVIKTDSDVQK